MKNVQERMIEMMQPIDQSIQLTDDRNDMLMLACAMLQRAREIFDGTIGEDGRRQMFKEMAND
jgi:hypothetical protein